MRTTALIALVLDLRAVIHDCSTTSAVHTAPPELGVEGVQDLSTHAADLLVAEQRNDVVPHETLVALARGGFDARDLQVALHQLSDGRGRPRLTSRIDLSGQAGPDLLGLRSCLRSSRNDLCEVVPLLRDRVVPGVHPHPQRPAGQLLNRPASTPRRGRGGRHGATVAPTRTTFDDTRPLGGRPISL